MGQKFNPVRSHTFMEIDHHIISMTILLPSTDSRRVNVSFKRKYVQKVLVKRLVMISNINCALDHENLSLWFVTIKQSK